MEPLLPWEVPELLEDHFSGPCLFKALYRFYRGAYFGQGFQFCGKPIKDKELKNSIDQLPLDIKRIILSKVWEKGEPFKGILVSKGQLYLPFRLHYLFLQYGKLKHIINPKVPRVYGGWTGKQVERKTYVFTYGPVDLSCTPLIPEFMCREKHNPLSPSFSLICP